MAGPTIEERLAQCEEEVNRILENLSDLATVDNIYEIVQVRETSLDDILISLFALESAISRLKNQVETIKKKI